MREEDLEGIREHTTRQITSLEEKIVALQLDTQRQDEIIENKLKSVRSLEHSTNKCVSVFICLILTICTRYTQKIF